MFKGLSFRLASVLLLFTSISTVRAETDTVRTVGIAASLQGAQLDLLLPIWLSDRVVLAPSFGFASAESISTEIDGGLNFRYYFSSRVLSSYFGFRVGVFSSSPASGASSTDLLGGIMLGGEYFLHPRFSIGAEAQLTGVHSGDHSVRFANPGKLNLNTGTGAFLTYYF